MVFDSQTIKRIFLRKVWVSNILTTLHIQLIEFEFLERKGSWNSLEFYMLLSPRTTIFNEDSIFWLVTKENRSFKDSDI